MFFSIIIPVYNEEKYIEDCLGKVFSQEESYEIIVVDDCSTDKSLDIILNIAKDRDNIKVIHNEENKGQSYSRNCAIHKAEGEYLFFLDADDYLRPGALRRLREYIENNQDCLDMIFFNYEIVWMDNLDKLNSKLLGNSLRFENTICSGPEWFIKSAKDNSHFFGVWTKLYRRGFIIDNKLFMKEGVIYEDYLYYVECMMVAKKVTHFPEIVIEYNKRRDRTTTRLTTKNFDSLAVITMELIKYWKEKGLSLQIEAPMRTFINQRISKLKYYRKIFPNYNPKVFDSGADQFIFDLITDYKEYGYADQIDIGEMGGYDNIIVYGAGVIGAEVVDFLSKNGVNNFRIAVTDKAENVERIGSKTVEKIDDIDVNKTNTLIIIAIGKSGRRNVADKLNSLGYRNLMMLD